MNIQQVMFCLLSLVFLACDDSPLPTKDDDMNSPAPYIPGHATHDGLPSIDGGPRKNAYEQYNYESESRLVSKNDMDQTDQTGAASTPYSIWKTSRRWQGIDVYVKSRFNGALGLSYLSFGVYAITNGGRTLVATGRFRGQGTSLAVAPDQVRVIQYRGIADVFEVVVERHGSAFSDEINNAFVSMVASDNCDEIVDDGGGVLPGVGLGGSAVGLTIAPAVGLGGGIATLPVTPVMLIGVNTAGVMQYLQIAAATGGATLGSFAIPAGESLIITDPAVLRRFTQQSLIVRPSTTPIVATIPVDLYYNAYFR